MVALRLNQRVRCRQWRIWSFLPGPVCAPVARFIDKQRLFFYAYAIGRVLVLLCCARLAEAPQDHARHGWAEK